MAVLATRAAPEGRVPSARRFLVLLCLGVVLVRLAYVPRPLRNDEGGYLLVARQWHTGGEFLYGDYFVDRPPFLLLIFRAAALTEWDHAIRAIAIPFVVLFVVAAWRAGSLLGGRTGGRWAALVAGSVMCSPGLAAEQADGELFGAAFVMGSLALALSAWREDDPRRRLWWAGAAGAVAATAPLIKQNLLEGVLLLAGLVVFGAWQGPGVRRRATLLAGPAVAGALLPCASFVLWLAAAGIEPATAWRDLVGFRGAAFDAIWSSAPDTSATRGALLLALGVVTGLVPVLVAWFCCARRCLPHSPVERRTITTLVLFGLAAIAAGGSYWPPYLLQLAPAAVLAVGAIAPMAGWAGAWMRTAGGTVTAAAVLGTAAGVVIHATDPSAWYSQRIGEWVAASKAPGDTAFVVYGLPSVLEAADTGSPYPHLWSVPMRTLDPDQQQLRATLAGPGAPAWIVQVTGFDAWGIDDGARLRDLVRDRYRVVGTVCGRDVWLRQDLTRELSTPPSC